jgi:hypothetical protein
MTRQEALKRLPRGTISTVCCDIVVAVRRGHHRLRRTQQQSETARIHSEDGRGSIQPRLKDAFSVAGTKERNTA